jgi:hypothetical protein
MREGFTMTNSATVPLNDGSDPRPLGSGWTAGQETTWGPRVQGFLGAPDRTQECPLCGWQRLEVFVHGHPWLDERWEVALVCRRCRVIYQAEPPRGALHGDEEDLIKSLWVRWVTWEEAWREEVEGQFIRHPGKSMPCRRCGDELIRFRIDGRPWEFGRGFALHPRCPRCGPLAGVPARYGAFALPLTRSELEGMECVEALRPRRPAAAIDSILSWGMRAVSSRWGRRVNAVRFREEAEGFAWTHDFPMVKEAWLGGGPERQAHGVTRELDGCPASLSALDRTIARVRCGVSDEWWTAATVETGAFVVGAGAYYGHVIAQHLGAQWEVSLRLLSNDRETYARRPEGIRLVRPLDGATIERPLVRVADLLTTEAATALRAAYARVAEICRARLSDAK